MLAKIIAYPIISMDEFIHVNYTHEPLEKNGYEKNLELLLIEIDWNGYRIRDAIKSFKLRVLIGEYNPNFRFERRISIPGIVDFNRIVSHYSSLFLARLSQLLSIKKTGTHG